MFHPLAMPQTIEDTFRLLLDKANAIADSIEQAFFLMVQLPYQLCMLADRGAVFISDKTRQLVDGDFYFENPRSLSPTDAGSAADVYKTSPKDGIAHRVASRQALTPLAGRDHEIAQLLPLWNRARSRSRTMVLLRGEAGIGKSRLLHDLRRRLGAHAKQLQGFADEALAESAQSMALAQRSRDPVRARHRLE